MPSLHPSRRHTRRPEPRRLLGVREVAETLGVSRAQVYSLLARGGFPPPVRLLGPTSHPRWLASDVEAYLEHRRTA